MALAWPKVKPLLSAFELIEIAALREANGRFISPLKVKPRRFNFPIVQRLPKYCFGIW